MSKQRSSLFACCFGAPAEEHQSLAQQKDATRSLSLTQGDGNGSIRRSVEDTALAIDKPPPEADAQRLQEDVTRVVSLLQELLNYSTNALRQPMSKAMSLLCARLPASYVCLYAISPSGQVFQQVAAAIGPDGQLTSYQRSNSNPNPGGSSASSCNLAGLGSPGTPAMRPSRPSHGTPHGTPKRPLEFGYAVAKLIAGSETSVERVVHSGSAVVLQADEAGIVRDLPVDFQQLHVDRGLRSFLALPIVPSGGSGRLLGVLALANLEATDWMGAWWMPSVQLVCGWAAGVLPQARATYRCAFFEKLMSAGSIQELAQHFVHQLPHVLIDQRLNKVECRLALVNSRLTGCTIYTSSTAEEVWEQGGYRVAVEQAAEEREGSIEHSGEQGLFMMEAGEVTAIPRPTQNSILTNALEWGDVMIVKDTVQYFGNSSSLGRDLHLPGRPLPKGTLVLLPLVHKCRMLGCVYILASWDVNGSISKQAFAELAELLGQALFSRLVVQLRQEWFAMYAASAPASNPPASPVGGSTVSGTWDGTFSTMTSTVASGPAPADVPGAAMALLLPTAEPQLGRLSSRSAAPSAAAGALDMDLGLLPAPDGGLARLPSEGCASESTLSAAATDETSSAACVLDKLPTPRQGALSRELVYWPELLDIVEDLQKGRHTCVYCASYQGSRVAVKVFRHPEGPEEPDMPCREADLERQLAALYRLSQLSHPNVVRHLMVFPAIYEVITRRSREHSSAFLTAVHPRRERFHRCCALVLELCSQHCSLRELLSRGLLSQQGQQEQLEGQPQQQGVSTSDVMLLQLGTSPPVSQSPGGGLAMLAAALGGLQPGAAGAAAAPPPVELLRSILMQIASGMQHLHSHGIVHGELRCENILVCGGGLAAACVAQQRMRRSSTGSEAGGSWSPSYVARMLQQQEQEQEQQQQYLQQQLVVKIKDAGITSAMLCQKQLLIRKMIGRQRPQDAPYLAPEVFRGEPLSRATDVYAFGLLMWELYCSLPAFASFANTPLKVLQTVVSDGGRPVFPEHTPAWYSSLAIRCWAGVAKQRPSFRRILAQLQSIDEEQGSF